MAIEDVIMPKFGMTMQEGTIGAWEVAVGDAVTEDQPLAVIVTDKVEADLEAPLDGVVAEILVAKGETVEVGVVVCRIETA